MISFPQNSVRRFIVQLVAYACYNFALTDSSDRSVWRVRKHETQSYRESCVFHFEPGWLYFFGMPLVYCTVKPFFLIGKRIVIHDRAFLRSLIARYQFYYCNRNFGLCAKSMSQWRNLHRGSFWIQMQMSKKHSRTGNFLKVMQTLTAYQLRITFSNSPNLLSCLDGSR